MIDYQTKKPIPEKDMDIRIWNHLKKYKNTYKFITGKAPEEKKKETPKKEDKIVKPSEDELDNK